MIVRFEGGADHRSEVARQALEEVGRKLGRPLRPLRTLGTGGVVAEVAGEGSAREAAAELAARPEVTYAEPDLLLHPLAVPDDSRYGEQWSLFEPAAGLNLPAAWEAARGEGATVAVLDTGYLPHPDLPGLLPGYDMVSSVPVANDGDGRDADPRDPGDRAGAGECRDGLPAADRPSTWHGTRVAGIVAAAAGNARGVAGVAPQARILPVRVLGKCGGYVSDVADGILWAASLPVPGAPANPTPARVLTLGLGAPGSCSATVQAAIERARAAGATVVAAAGNGATDADFTPASCGGTLTVAAVDRRGGRAPYSNHGAAVDLAAPGGDLRGGAADGVLSLAGAGADAPAGAAYGFSQGTSMAAAHVAGAAALLYGLKPQISPDEVERILTGAARPFPEDCDGCSAGLADAAAAVAAVSGGGRRDGGTLANKAQRAGLEGGAGAEIVFALSVPARATRLTVRQSGGSGDADLYLRYGAPPTAEEWDHRPDLRGNEESVTLQPVRPGAWYVMVRGAAPFSGVSLAVSWEEPPPPPAACPVEASAYKGSLTDPGDYRQEPWGSHYYSARGGVHKGALSGPRGANFDLLLYKWSGGSWREVARSAGGGPDETVAYGGTAGYYSWRVLSVQEGGSYLFCLTRP